MICFARDELAIRYAFGQVLRSSQSTINHVVHICSSEGPCEDSPLRVVPHSSGSLYNHYEVTCLCNSTACTSMHVARRSAVA